MILRNVLTLPAVRGIDLDAPEALLVHRKILQEKKFLRRMYEGFYAYFLQELGPRASGKVLELGSGGGFLKEKLPSVITSDTCAAEFIDRVIDAEHLPFAPGELDGIVLLDVLHHLPAPRAFLREALRCLKPGGRLIMIEPFNSWFGKLTYVLFHHEPWDDKVREWELSPGGRLTTANIAMAWNIFWRDREIFEKEFPELRIVKRAPHTTLLYLLSGGMSLRSLLPGFLYPAMSAVDRTFSKLTPVFPTLQTIVLEKDDRHGT